MSAKLSVRGYVHLRSCALQSLLAIGVLCIVGVADKVCVALYSEQHATHATFVFATYSAIASSCTWTRVSVEHAYGAVHGSCYIESATIAILLWRGELCTIVSKFASGSGCERCLGCDDDGKADHFLQ